MGNRNFKMNPENHKKGKDKFNAEETVSRLYPYIFRVFDVYEVQNSGEALYFYGTPRTNTENVTGELWEPLQHFGFGCTLKYELGEYVLLVFPEKKAKEKNWINLVLFIATFFLQPWFAEPGCQEQTSKSIPPSLSEAYHLPLR